MEAGFENIAIKIKVKKLRDECIVSKQKRRENGR